MGVKLPKIITNALTKLRDENDNRDDGSGDSSDSNQTQIDTKSRLQDCKAVGYKPFTILILLFLPQAPACGVSFSFKSTRINRIRKSMRKASTPFRPRGHFMEVHMTSSHKTRTARNAAGGFELCSDFRHLGISKNPSKSFCRRVDATIDAAATTALCPLWKSLCYQGETPVFVQTSAASPGVIPTVPERPMRREEIVLAAASAFSVYASKPPQILLAHLLYRRPLWQGGLS